MQDAAGAGCGRGIRMLLPHLREGALEELPRDDARQLFALLHGAGVDLPPVAGVHVDGANAQGADHHRQREYRTDILAGDRLGEGWPVSRTARPHVGRDDRPRARQRLPGRPLAQIELKLVDTRGDLIARRNCLRPEQVTQRRDRNTVDAESVNEQVGDDGSGVLKLAQGVDCGRELPYIHS